MASDARERLTKLCERIEYMPQYGWMARTEDANAIRQVLVKVAALEAELSACRELLDKCCDAPLKLEIAEQKLQQAIRERDEARQAAEQAQAELKREQQAAFAAQMTLARECDEATQRAEQAQAACAELKPVLIASHRHYGDHGQLVSCYGPGYCIVADAIAKVDHGQPLLDELARLREACRDVSSKIHDAAAGRINWREDFAERVDAALATKEPNQPG